MGFSRGYHHPPHMSWHAITSQGDLAVNSSRATQFRGRQLGRTLVPCEHVVMISTSLWSGCWDNNRKLYMYVIIHIYIYGIWKERKVPDPDEAIHGCHGEPSKVTVRMMRSPGHPMWTEGEGIANDVPTQDSWKITFLQRQSKFFEPILKLIPVFFYGQSLYSSWFQFPSIAILGSLYSL